MAEPRPVKIKFHMTVEMSDGKVDELIVPELDMTILGAGLTCRLLDDLRTEGIVSQTKPTGPKVPGLVLALRGALVEQPDGELYTQRRTEPVAPGSVVAVSEAPEGRRGSGNV